MASLYSQTYQSKKTGKITTYWYVSYFIDGRRHAKCAGILKSVGRELKKQVEAELRTRKFDFLNQPDDVRIDESVAEYLEQIRTLRKFNTFTRYRNALTHFLRFLQEKLSTVQVVRRLSEAHFNAYRVWRRRDTITPNGRSGSQKKKVPTFRTINNELGVFRSWLNWAVTAGHAQKNPLHAFEKLRTTDSKSRRTLTRAELESLIQASAAIESEKPSRKNQTLVWRFLASTGLRIGELIHLQWKDVDFRRKVIVIRPKPDWDPKTYEREMPFTRGSEDVLAELKKIPHDSEALVFATTGGRPYRENKMRDWLLECGERAGIRDMRGPHDLRHTFITLALTEFGIDVPTVQKIVGHAKLETTQAYLHPTTDHIRTAVRKYDLQCPGDTQ